jgi:thiamine-phosphate pyrophosphorylase
LYPILDAEMVLGGGDPAEERWNVLRKLVRELADAGVEILQYRNKRDEDGVVAQDALAMREAAPSLRLILNDRPALVAAAGWDGVHVGQEDLSPREARRLVGTGRMVGVSTHDDQQVLAANPETVDYIAIGPVFATASKINPGSVIGLEGVARARALTEKPLVAIGGITRETAPAVYEAGADAVAVISAIFGRGVPAAKAAKDFLDLFK